MLISNEAWSALFLKFARIGQTVPRTTLGSHEIGRTAAGFNDILKQSSAMLKLHRF